MTESERFEKILRTRTHMAPFTVHDLEKRVQDRAKAEPGASYTRTLLDKGVAHCAKKLGEEAVEVAIAAIAEDRGRVVAETADLALPPARRAPRARHPAGRGRSGAGGRTQQTGLDEKAARKGG